MDIDNIMEYGESRHLFAVYDIYNPHIHDLNGMRNYLNGKLIPSCTFTGDEFIDEINNGGIDEYLRTMYDFYTVHHKLLVRKMGDALPGYETYLDNANIHEPKFVKIFYESKEHSMFDDPEMICVDKTVWIRILQRHIRKWLAKKREEAQSQQGYGCVVM